LKEAVAETASEIIVFGTLIPLTKRKEREKALLQYNYSRKIQSDEMFHTLPREEVTP